MGKQSSRPFVDACGVVYAEAKPRLTRLVTGSGELLALNTMCSIAGGLVAALFAHGREAEGNEAFRTITRQVATYIASKGVDRADEQVTSRTGIFVSGWLTSFENPGTVRLGEFFAALMTTTRPDIKQEQILHDPEFYGSLERTLGLTAAGKAEKRRAETDRNAVLIPDMGIEKGMMLQAAVMEMFGRFQAHANG